MTVAKRANKRFSYSMSEDKLKDMNFLCELRDFIESTVTWDSSIHFHKIAEGIEESEKDLMLLLGSELYLKRLDHENAKKKREKQKKVKGVK